MVGATEPQVGSIWQCFSSQIFGRSRAKRPAWGGEKRHHAWPAHRARQVVATIAVVTMGFLVANSGANAGTKLMRTPDGDSCAQADSAPPQSLPAVIEACDVVVTQAQGGNLGRFHRYRGRALQKSAELTRARSDFDQALAILAERRVEPQVAGRSPRSLGRQWRRDRGLQAFERLAAQYFRLAPCDRQTWRSGPATPEVG